MTTVTFQNGRKLTFNPIYFTNEFVELQFFLYLNISLSLSNKYADYKKFCRSNFLKQKKYFSNLKKNIYRFFLNQHFDTTLLS